MTGPHHAPLNAPGTTSPAGAAEGELVEIEREGPIAMLWLNRPRAYNALSEAMLDRLEAALVALGGDESVSVIVLGGRGPAFCAGHDLKELRTRPDIDYYRRLFDRCSRMMMTIRRLPLPVIARVHGIATAAGCQLVAACDLAVAGEEARFATSGINLDLFCATPSVALSRNVGRKQAFEMLVTGDFVDAATAARHGLVNRVAPAAALDAEVRSLAERIVRQSRPVVAAGKALFYRQIEMGYEAALQLAGQSMACNLIEPDTQEGVQAFLEKRPRNPRSN